MSASAGHSESIQVSAIHSMVHTVGAKSNLVRYASNRLSVATPPRAEPIVLRLQVYTTAKCLVSL